MSKIELKWIRANRLTQRWGISYAELALFIDNEDLPMYDFDKRPLKRGTSEKDAELPKWKRKIGHHIIATKEHIVEKALQKVLFKLEDVERLEKKNSKNERIGSRPQKPILLDRFPQNYSQEATGGGKMSKIEVPWINGRRLMERWDINLDELYQAIFFLHLPVYNSNYEREEGIEFKEYDVNGESGYHSNNLFDLDQLSNTPMWPYIEGESVDEVLCSLHFYMKDIKQFEKKYSKPIQKEKDGLIPKEAQELGRLRIEKSKWDDSIKASVNIGLSCNELSKQGKKITRDMLYQKLSDLKFKDLPNTTIEKIWKAIPEKYRKKTGRPPKNKT